MGGAERVGRRITSEVRWDQSHLIPLSSHQAPKNYFANTQLFSHAIYLLSHLGWCCPVQYLARGKPRLQPNRGCVLLLHYQMWGHNATA